MPTPFTDRFHAGRLLAAQLSSFVGHQPIVFGLPRGGVPVAYEVAQHLGAPLDVALVRTVRAPSDGGRLLATILEGDPPEVRIEPDWDKAQDVSRAWLDEQVSEALAEIAERRRRYRDGDRLLCSAGRVAILVDQAIGLGHTMAGAIRLIRQSRPSMIVAAVPVACAASADRFARTADRLLCLHRDGELGPLGRYYGQPEQTTHEEALECLARAADEEN